jgi:hypothetical protein
MMNQSNPHNDSPNAAEPLEREIWDFARLGKVAWDDVFVIPHAPQAAIVAAHIFEGPPSILGSADCSA